jgi:hypothetical protein
VTLDIPELFTGGRTVVTAIEGTLNDLFRGPIELVHGPVNIIRQPGADRFDHAVNCIFM